MPLRCRQHLRRVAQIPRKLLAGGAEPQVLSWVTSGCYAFITCSLSLNHVTPALQSSGGETAECGVLLEIGHATK